MESQLVPITQRRKEVGEKVIPRRAPAIRGNFRIWRGVIRLRGPSSTCTKKRSVRQTVVGFEFPKRGSPYCSPTANPITAYVKKGKVTHSGREQKKPPASGSTGTVGERVLPKDGVKRLMAGMPAVGTALEKKEGSWAHCVLPKHPGNIGSKKHRKHSGVILDCKPKYA